MDSHSFRSIGDELIELLDGARLEKIHGPRPGVLVFTFFAGEKKRRLLFRFERQAPLLFFSEQRLANPSHPPATVMRLRKYCAGRRLGRGVLDYAARRLAFPVVGGAVCRDTSSSVIVTRGAGPKSPAPPCKNSLFSNDKLLPPTVALKPIHDQCWLVLDMVEGAFVHNTLPEDFVREPVWPGPEIVEALCSLPWKKGGGAEGVWQDYAVLTPLLRETLAALEALDGRALLVDLEAGGGGLFLYADRCGKPVLYTAWPLPEALCERRGITAYPEKPLLSLQEESYPTLAASALVDELKFFAELGWAVHKEADAPVRKASKKQARLLAKLDQEHKRLTAMLAQRENAVALQGVLWRYTPDARLEFVDIGAGDSGPVRRVELNALFSVGENMARMFKESVRGARGLAILEARRAEVLAAPSETDEGPTGPDSVARAAPRHSPAEEGSGAGEIKNVGRFRSADGFIMLRGKNARGNQSLLKIGAPHDLWLHAEDGPSAHLIIRRSHAAEEIPESTLREAALLVAEKSWQRHNARARIMVALLRHVHAVKGAAPGTVKVDTVQRGIVVPLSKECPAC